jgi:hypothetical protein
MSDEWHVIDEFAEYLLLPQHAFERFELFEVFFLDLF